MMAHDRERGAAVKQAAFAVRAAGDAAFETVAILRLPNVLWAGPLPRPRNRSVGMMGEFVVMTSGVLLGLLVLFVGILVASRLDARQEERRQERRKSRLRDYKSAGRLSSAYAASDLVPWVLDMGDLKGCRIQVLGGDGTYINQENGHVWSDGLEEWTKRGLDVDYILLGADEPTRQQYIRLMNKLNRDGSARLRVMVARKPVGGYPDGVKETEEDLHTCHPTLLYGSDDSKRAMWIEGDHQPHSEFAYDVWYVPPNAMNDDRKAEFEHYERQVESIRSYCVELDAATV